MAKYLPGGGRLPSAAVCREASSTVNSECHGKDPPYTPDPGNRSPGDFSRDTHALNVIEVIGDALDGAIA